MNNTWNPENSHPSVFNMHEPFEKRAQYDLLEIEKRNKVRENVIRYKLIADLMAGKEVDITVDSAVFTALNRERVCIEEFMNLHIENGLDESINEAKEAARSRRAADERDWNPHSEAKWRNLGFLPKCISELFAHVYPDTKEHKRAIRRFLNEFPEFRISTKRLKVDGLDYRKAAELNATAKVD